MMTQPQTSNLMSVTEQHTAARNDDPITNIQSDVSDRYIIPQLEMMNQSQTSNLMLVTEQHTAARNDDPITNIQPDVSDRTAYCS